MEILEQAPLFGAGATPVGGAPLAAVNVGATERWASLIAGGALTLYGLRRRGTGGLALAAAGGALVHRGITGRSAVYRRLAISTTAASGAAREMDAARSREVRESVTVSRPAEELYRFWRALETLPSFMTHLEAVRVLDDRRSHWVAKGPAGRTVEWDAEIVEDRADELITWRSVEGSAVANAGSVRFRPAPAGRGTEVKVTVHYEPPAGKVGVAVAKLLHEEPGQLVRDDLRRFKRLMEAGEIPTTRGQPSGRAGGERTVS
jgi:uncharacterized membrane protein